MFCLQDLLSVKFVVVYWQHTVWLNSLQTFCSDFGGFSLEVTATISLIIFKAARACNCM